MYPEFFIAPMRDELTRLGAVEWRTAADVDKGLRETPGTVMVVGELRVRLRRRQGPVRAWPWRCSMR